MENRPSTRNQGRCFGDNGECIRMSSAHAHNHEENCEQRFIDLVAVEKMQRDAMNLHNYK